MRKLQLFLLIAMAVMAGACSQADDRSAAPVDAAWSERFVLVEGGAFVNTHSGYYGEAITIPDFYMGKYEVTQQEWMEVMGSNPSEFQGGDLPVEMVSWYDAVEYCNLRSIQEGLQPYYKIDKTKKDRSNKSEYDPVKWTVTIRKGANGYRLPTEAEWEYAASGGRMSQNYKYSGSDTAEDAAWYWRNAGDEPLEGEWSWSAIESNNSATKAVGSKKPNELGLYDMSGNVREWCWDWYVDERGNSGLFRVVKGGGWIGDVSNNEISFRGKFEASGIGPDQGLRLVRGA